MHKNYSTKKFLLSAFMLITSVSIFLAGCSSSKLTREEIAQIIGTDYLPVETLGGSYSIDVTSLREVVGDSDYVVVAEVKDYLDTTYSVSGTPLTEYSILVVENIKGNLDSTTEINLIKEGGINEKNDKFLIYEGDILPRVGNYYIFCIYGQSSGAIRVCGAGYTLDIENSLSYQDEQNYLDILDAYENEIVSERTRYQSHYEVD